MYSGKHSDDRKIRLITCGSFAALKKNVQIYEGFPLFLFARVWKYHHHAFYILQALFEYFAAMDYFVPYVTSINEHITHTIGKTQDNSTKTKTTHWEQPWGYFMMRQSESKLAVTSL